MFSRIGDLGDGKPKLTWLISSTSEKGVRAISERDIR
jgi:hypothetical protein